MVSGSGHRAGGVLRGVEKKAQEASVASLLSYGHRTPGGWELVNGRDLQV